MASPRLPGCCRLHDYRVRTGDAACQWCHPPKPKAPAPTPPQPLAAGSGILLGRRLTSLAAAAPALAALMQAQPRACRQAAPWESWRSAPSCSLPATPPDFPCEESTAPGWFLTERSSAGGGGKVSLPKPVLPPLFFPDFLGESEHPSLTTGGSI